jgi:hypothetical protein
MEFSPAMARIKSEVAPLVQELEDLEGIPEPTPDDITRIDTLHTEITAKKSAFEAAAERQHKRVQAGSVLDLFNEPAPQPRAVYERPSTGNGSAPVEHKTLTDYLTDSREFKHPRNGQYYVVEPVPPAVIYPFLETKAPFVPGNLNQAHGPVRIISPTDPALRFPLLELLRTVPTDELSVAYLPLTFTNTAAEVAYAQPKPESTNAGSILTIMMKTVATWKEAPRQILRYIPRLRAVIEDELRMGVLAKVQTQVLNGPGTGDTILGILAQVTNVAAGADLITQIFTAIGNIESAGGVVDGILMNPGDYARLVQNEYTNNQYNPLIAGERFGQYRIIRTGAQAAGTATVGDFSSAVTLFVGENANVQATEALGFKTNVVTIRCDMDVVVLVERPWLLYKCPGPLTAV